MTTFTFTKLNNYHNNGQNIEQSIRYTMTGKIEKADNVPATKAGDCGQYQIKSARATICKGTDIDAYIATNAASAYIYGTNDGIAYIMNKQEFKAFAVEFGTLTKESSKNGGAEKIRLGHETKKMLDWLSERA